LRGQSDLSAFIHAFAGSHVYVADYLTGKALTRQSEPVRAFLLQTSVLERLSAPLCYALIKDARKGPDAGQPASVMFEQVEQANLFLVPLDSERHWFRYHHRRTVAG